MYYNHINIVNIGRLFYCNHKYNFSELSVFKKKQKQQQQQKKP